MPMSQKRLADRANSEYCNTLRLFCDFTRETCTGDGAAGRSGKDCQILLLKRSPWVVPKLAWNLTADKWS